MSVTPWGGLELSGITIAQAAGSHDVSMTHAPTVQQPAAAIESTPTNASAAGADAATVVPSPPVTAKDQLPGRGSKRAVAPEVRRVTVKNGDFMFLDQAG